jgi:GxxExxY protein
LEQRPVQYVLRLGEYFHAFDGVLASICPACDWRAVEPADVRMKRQAVNSRKISAKGMLNVPLYAFSEAQRVILKGKPLTDRAAGPGLVQDSAYSELTGRFIGWSMDSHNEHGPGHKEGIYHNDLAIRMEKEQVVFEIEPTIAVENKDGELIGLYYPDFIVEDILIVELKAHSWPITNDEIAQVIDYFAGTNCNVALLFNFGRPRLEWRRLYPPKKIQEHRRKQWGKPLD